MHEFEKGCVRKSVADLDGLIGAHILISHFWLCVTILQVRHLPAFMFLFYLVRLLQTQDDTLLTQNLGLRQNRELHLGETGAR